MEKYKEQMVNKTSENWRDWRDEGFGELLEVWADAKKDRFRFIIIIYCC